MVFIFVFTWLVLPVIVGVTGTEAAVAWLFWSWLGCSIFKISYAFTLYLGGAVFLVTTSFEMVVLVGVPLGAQFGDLPV